MAMACLRLFTVPPFPPLPDFSVPLFLRRIALATVLPAALPYLLPLDFFCCAIFLSRNSDANPSGRVACRELCLTTQTSVKNKTPSSRMRTEERWARRELTTKDTKVHERNSYFRCVPSCPLWFRNFLAPPSVLRRRLVNFFADRHRLVLTLAARLPRHDLTRVLDIRMAGVDRRILPASLGRTARSHVGLAVTIHVPNRDPLLMPIILRHLLACGLAALRVTRCQIAMHHFLIAHGSSRSLARSSISRRLHRSRGLVLFLLRLLFVGLRHRHQRQTRKSQYQNLALHLFSPMCGERTTLALSMRAPDKLSPFRLRDVGRLRRAPQVTEVLAGRVARAPSPAKIPSMQPRASPLVRLGRSTTSEPALREAEGRQTASLLSFRGTC